MPIVTPGGGGGGASSPGFEISYTQITAQVNVVSTTEATGTAIISPGAITFDGTPVLVHFFSPRVTPPAAAGLNGVTLSLFEGATQIGQLGSIVENAVAAVAEGVPISAFLRFTPTAASHTYTVTAFANSTTGTPAVLAGAGGTSTLIPAFLRFTKV